MAMRQAAKYVSVKHTDRLEMALRQAAKYVSVKHTDRLEMALRQAAKYVSVKHTDRLEMAMRQAAKYVSVKHTDRLEMALRQAAKYVSVKHTDRLEMALRQAAKYVSVKHTDRLEMALRQAATYVSVKYNDRLEMALRQAAKYLTNDTPKYHSKIDDIANRLSDWKAQIQARYKHTRVIILECPPYSIVAYNKANGHPNPAEGSLEQTARLEQQIYYLNALIRNINNKNLKVTTKQSKVDLNNNLTESDKAGKTKPNRYTSPNFSSDVLRQTKYQRQQTKYYVDYKVYTDGIHPGPTLAKLWLRRICQRIIQLCY
ncbi:unnamed protein product [Mytilus edulis]|uniref:Uncharacterized protein n=1 Tax=Mytilus edulis TaxID=6550 RepID=A0A8S3S2F4_MYTED|nr:unnamed protein product [Mytilus edulis]